METESTELEIRKNKENLKPLQKSPMMLIFLPNKDTTFFTAVLGTFFLKRRKHKHNLKVEQLSLLAESHAFPRTTFITFS